MPNVIELLKKDHDEVKTIFDEYESGADLEKKKELSKKAFKELEIHTQVEEEIFYPEVKDQAGSEELRNLVSHSQDEHNTVKEVIADLRARDVDEEAYETKMNVLMEDVRHHIEEEESDLFPLAQKEENIDWDEMGSRVEERKKQLKTED